MLKKSHANCHCCSRMPASQRGAASMEAVVAIPFLILVFAGILYVGNRAEAAQAARDRARSCAWLYSANGCREVPPSCQGVLSTGTASRHDDGELRSTFERTQQAARQQPDRNGEPPPDPKGALQKIVGGIIGSVIEDLFGRTTSAHTERVVRRPKPLGGGKLAVEGDYHLACNLAPQKPLDVVKDAWRTLVRRN